MEEGWYYEGAGIYRHVWLNKTAPLHIATYGTFVTSEVKENSADVTVHATMINEESRTASFTISNFIINGTGKVVATGKVKETNLNENETKDYSSIITIHRPSLWSVETPNLYKVITTITKGDSVIDSYETTFGIRTLRFDAEKGFFLNGKHLLLRGANMHQDHAGVGTAIPDALQYFRVKRLKEMGANAIRCSHNPATPELLDVCDRLGMLVVDENRLLGTTAEHLDLIKQMILRDRNHPSVFIWSIGNEEWDLEGNIAGARVAATVQKFVQKLDPTRRVTYANSGGWGKGISTVQDVMGFNYISNGDIDEQHAKFPHQPSIGTEETTTRGTRGVYEDNIPLAHMAATDRKPSGYSMEQGIKFYMARPFLSGMFFWTGFDYRGEPHPFGWPQVASQSGIFDLCGFPKDMFYYLKSFWTEQPIVHIFPHWNWKGKESQVIDLWAYSNCDEVELFINNKSAGRKTVPQYSHCEWKVPYEAGTVLAYGYKDGKEITSDVIETAEEPASVRLVPDRDTINADNEDVSIITVKIEDQKGRIVSTAGNAVMFSLQGPGKIIGVGNGDPSSHEEDRNFEHVLQLEIENLKTKSIQSTETQPALQFSCNDSAWQTMVNAHGDYVADLKDTTHQLVIRGIFTLPEITKDMKISLWPKSLGEEQAIYINGRLIAQRIKRDDPVQEYILDNTFLKSGKNIYAILGKPLLKRFQYDNLNTDPGCIQVIIPAQQWKRKVFNGFAQIIVQSSREQGNLILTASSERLNSGVAKIITKSVALRPAVILK